MSLEPYVTVQADVPRPSSNVSTRSARVWLLTNAPSPYQSELFTAMARRSDLTLSVRFMRSSSSSGRATVSQFDAVTMTAWLPERVRDEVRLHPRAVWESAVGQFDYFVLSGLYTSITFLCCAVLMTLRGKPWGMWLERPHRDHSPTYRPETSLVGRLRNLIRGWLMRSASQILCIGSAAAREYQQLGVPAEKLAVLPYCCDLARYDAVDEADIARWRSTQGLSDQCVFLFSGQLIDRKGVDTLLSAFGRLAEEDPACVLLILGEGPRRASFEQSVAARHRSRVRFLGHLPQAELPTVFRAADVFVFPSRHDGWAVVINEACAACLPVIATPQTGATHDLVEPLRSGYVVEADDIDGFYSAMAALARTPDDRRRMGRRSRELVEQFSPAHGAATFAACVHRVLLGTNVETPSA